MELFGILLSIPAAFVASCVYAYALAKGVKRFEAIRRPMLSVSTAVLLAIGVELALLVAIGPRRTRGLLGGGYYSIHLLLFFLGTPALANVIVLRKEPRILRSWFAAVPLCTVLAFGQVLAQYAVSESLFGIEGHGGPYCGDWLSLC